MAAEPPTLSTILTSFLNEAKTAVLLTYNQPKISNAFTIAQYHDLAAALTWAKHHPTIITIVLTGAGKHYCAGKVLLSPDEGGPTIAEEIAAGSALGNVIRNYPKVLIAAVNGAAIGWGCTQLWNFDLVYASERAFFQTPFTKLGFVPEGGSSYTFLKVMGRAKAMRLLLGSERVSARDMAENGFVTEVLPAEGFVEAVCAKAKTIAGYPQESVRLVKELCAKSQEELDAVRSASERERVALQRVLSGDAAKKAMSDLGSGRGRGSCDLR
ncbi:Enoyl-CoA delta isomerase 2, mitochondrial [Cyphellophora attinorum]|uniref:Enoyl-CoA delta isomerase 2, mitochondrial n=1 Tax=Cyphellophora attinorum TaxID=1664694 RepID=A0A0N0NLP2_9EURO|nr:Enoyl-CoA delta isomerase 2, mitochondrial [Phialophora attinorum]KPI39408.1 Enoyl-CoA delta isomerase 2, mitochondrial [Phialophora attinorum]